jgi:signal peptidase I
MLVKRVIAIGGDRIRIQKGSVVLNGHKLEEPYVHHASAYEASGDSWPLEPAGAGVLDVAIPDEHYFLMGDNREKSKDSRFSGSVHLNDITGTVVYVFRITTNSVCE